MRTQVRDLDYDTPPALSGAVTVSRAWAALQTNKAKSIPAIPVTNENGELYGMLSPSEIASYDMRTLSDSRVDRIPVFNLLSVLDGKILNESGYLTDTISGEVSIALPQNNENLLFKGPDAIVIVGEQPEMARRAVEQQVSCLIVCQAELPDDIREMAKDKNALACSRVFQYIASRPGRKEVMLLMNSLTDVPHWSENVCWFYDTDFEYLADESIVRVVCTGLRCEDYKLRCLMAGVPEDRLACAKDEHNAAAMMAYEPGDELYVLYGTDTLELAYQVYDQMKDIARSRAAEQEVQA